MPKWGILNASLFLNEHGHPPFLFQNWSSQINIQRNDLKQHQKKLPILLVPKAIVSKSRRKKEDKRKARKAFFAFGISKE